MGGAVDAALASRIHRSVGVPLAEPIQRRMERGFGQSFADVRVHRDSDTAPRIQAAAFTIGTDIHFARGQYSPGSPQGEGVLAHELAHVVQNNGGQAGRVQRLKQRKNKRGAKSHDVEEPEKLSHETLKALKTALDKGQGSKTFGDFVYTFGKGDDEVVKEALRTYAKREVGDMEQDDGAGASNAMVDVDDLPEDELVEKKAPKTRSKPFAELARLVMEDLRLSENEFTMYFDYEPLNFVKGAAAGDLGAPRVKQIRKILLAQHPLHRMTGSCGQTANNLQQALSAAHGQYAPAFAERATSSDDLGAKMKHICGLLQAKSQVVLQITLGIHSFTLEQLDGAVAISQSFEGQVNLGEELGKYNFTLKEAVELLMGAVASDDEKRGAAQGKLFGGGIEHESDKKLEFYPTLGIGYSEYQRDDEKSIHQAITALIVRRMKEWDSIEARAGNLSAAKFAEQEKLWG